MNNFELSRKVVQTLLEKKLEIAHAESCTGGLLSKYITDQPGASAVFQCGVVSYSGKIKHHVLGVSEDTLRQYGEVSAETAREMAEGVRRLAKSDIGAFLRGFRVMLVFLDASLFSSVRTPSILLVILLVK